MRARIPGGSHAASQGLLPPRAAVPAEAEIVTLAPEAKHLTDTSKMVAYRAETALARCPLQHYVRGGRTSARCC